MCLKAAAAGESGTSLTNDRPSSLHCAIWDHIKQIHLKMATSIWLVSKLASWRDDLLPFFHNTLQAAGTSAYIFLHCIVTGCPNFTYISIQSILDWRTVIDYVLDHIQNLINAFLVHSIPILQILWKSTIIHTHTTVLRLFGFCPGQPGWAGTRRNIHPLTPIVVIKYPYLLSPSTTMHGILPIQSMRFTVLFHNLSPSFLWSTSWPGTLHLILHTFLHPIIVFFLQHMPIPSQPLL